MSDGLTFIRTTYADLLPGDVVVDVGMFGDLGVMRRVDGVECSAPASPSCSCIHCRTKPGDIIETTGWTDDDWRAFWAGCQRNVSDDWAAEDRERYARPGERLEEAAAKFKQACDAYDAAREATSEARWAASDAKVRLQTLEMEEEQRASERDAAQLALSSAASGRQWVA